MKFTDKVQKQFEIAGWKPNRNAKESYDERIIKNHPSYIKEFLYSYGDLIVPDCKIFKTDVISKLIIKPEYTFFDDEINNEEILNYYKELLGKYLYPFALFENDGYIIACDDLGNIYMVGDYTFLIANNLKDGIEKLLLCDWNNGYYELDESTGKWIKNKKWNE